MRHSSAVDPAIPGGGRDPNRFLRSRKSAIDWQSIGCNRLAAIDWLQSIGDTISSENEVTGDVDCQQAFSTRRSSTPLRHPTCNIAPSASRRIRADSHKFERELVHKTEVGTTLRRSYPANPFEKLDFRHSPVLTIPVDRCTLPVGGPSVIKSFVEFVFRTCVLVVLLIAIAQVSSFVPTDPSQIQNGRWAETELDPLETWERNPQHPHPEQPIQRSELVARRR